MLKSRLRAEPGLELDPLDDTLAAEFVLCVVKELQDEGNCCEGPGERGEGGGGEGMT